MPEPAGWPLYLVNAVKTLLSLNFRGDALVRHNLAGRPALDGIASLWMFAGLGVTARWRDAWRSHLALPAALGVNLLPMVFTDGAPGFGRTLGPRAS